MGVVFKDWANIQANFDQEGNRLGKNSIVEQRLHNQQIGREEFDRPDQVVGWMGAVQSQDFGAAKWAVAQRGCGLSEIDLDQAFDAGQILRTHVLRPTWHFVTPEDIGWMLELTAPRVNQTMGTNYRKYELDEATFVRSRKVLEQAFQGEKFLERFELIAALQQAGIDTRDSLRANLLIMRAELEGVICSGPRRGKQHTYALLSERAPGARKLDQEEALAALARRYFQSHGPATLKDYRWWSGLLAKDAQAGLELVKSQFLSERVNGQEYWFPEPRQGIEQTSPSVYLLPNYDEYMVGYQDRGAIFDASLVSKLDSRANSLLGNTIVVNGQIVGIWKRTLKAREVNIDLNLFLPLNPELLSNVHAAAHRYGEFVKLPVVLTERRE